MGWTIRELTDAAAAALGGDPAQVNGRIRDLPGERMIRWYTTIGLVDPPLARRGRTALYGRRHLLQLVAIKRRQAAGRTIAQIQVELTGATDHTLERLAGLPPESAAEPPAAPGTRARFWTAAARDHAEVPGSAAGGTHPVDSSWPGDRALIHDDLAHDDLVQGVRLASGALLLLDGDPHHAALTADDLAALRAAARPLLDELSRRGLLPAAPPSAQFRTGRST
jgi:DNA-binding transcriptional MerR regulator